LSLLQPATSGNIPRRLNPDASPETDELLAVDYWRWRIDNPYAISYLAEKQGLDLASHGRRVVLMGARNLAALAPGATVIDLDDEMIEQFRFTRQMFESVEDMVSAGSSRESGGESGGGLAL